MVRFLQMTAMLFATLGNHRQSGHPEFPWRAAGELGRLMCEDREPKAVAPKCKAWLRTLVRTIRVM